jgi:hypothetical protein
MFDHDHFSYKFLIVKPHDVSLKREAQYLVIGLGTLFAILPFASHENYQVFKEMVGLSNLLFFIVSVVSISYCLGRIWCALGNWMRYHSNFGGLVSTPERRAATLDLIKKKISTQFHRDR